MRLKPGVRIRGIRPETVLAIVIVQETFAMYDISPVITSIADGVHSKNSLHYQGAAFDIRSRDIPPAALTRIVDDLKSCLGVDFDVVLEKDHIQVEYQPHKE